MANSLLSGTPGIPDGAYTLLQQSDLEQAVRIITQDVIDSGGGGGGTGELMTFTELLDDTTSASVVGNDITMTAVDAGEDAVVVWDESLGKKVYLPLSELSTGAACTPYWTRYTGDGTAVAGSGNITVTREAIGTYLLEADEAFDDVGGFFQYGVLVSVSAKAGDGSDGISPLRAFSDHNLEDTDDPNAGYFFPHPTNGKLYLMGTGAGSVFIHDRNNFGSGPTIVDLGTYGMQAGHEGGVLSVEGDYVAVGGDSDSYGVRVMRTSDNAVFDLSDTPGPGDPATNMTVIAARNSGGTLALWIMDGSDCKRYHPNLGTLLLGASNITYSSSSTWLTVGCGVWDAEDYFWVSTSNKFTQIDPDTNAAYEHTYPLSGSPGNITRACFDPIGRRFFVLLTDGTNRQLWQFSGWTNGIAATGTWNHLMTSTGDNQSFYFDPATNILFISNRSNGYVERHVVGLGPSLTFIDHVPVDDTGADIDIDYDNLASITVFYEGTKGYVTGTKSASGQAKMIEIVYEGGTLALGTGGALLTRTLHAAYEIISATEAYIYVYTDTGQLQFVDAECTVAFQHCDQTEGGGGGGGGGEVSGPIVDTDLTATDDTVLVGTGTGIEEVSFASLVVLLGVALHGQCRLVYTSTTQIDLTRYSGIGGLIIDGAQQTVPTAGVSASNSGLSADTTYFVYAYMNTGTMTLEFSATGFANDDGVMAKSGNTTRTLVGMIRTNGSAQFASSTYTQFVRSWFHDKGIASTTGISNSGVGADSDWVEMNSAYRLNYLAWSGETITVSANAWATAESAVNQFQLNLSASSAGQGFTTIGTTGSGWQGGALAVSTASPAGSSGFAFASVYRQVTQTSDVEAQLSVVTGGSGA